jgi:hypothetical protein
MFKDIARVASIKKNTPIKTGWTAIDGRSIVACDLERVEELLAEFPILINEFAFQYIRSRESCIQPVLHADEHAADDKYIAERMSMFVEDWEMDALLENLSQQEKVYTYRRMWDTLAMTIIEILWKQNVKLRAPYMRRFPQIDPSA